MEVETSEDLSFAEERFNLRDFLKFLTSSKKTVFGLVIFVVLLILGIIGPYITPANPNTQNLTQAYLPPFWVAGGSILHILGTDGLGRDVFSRLLYGFQVAAYVAFIGAALAGAIGIPIGLTSGFFRGKFDGVTMRVVDMWMSIPPVVLSISLILILGIALNNIVIAIVVVDWTRFTRVVRGEVFNIREKDYIMAAKATGYGDMRIILREVLPNITPLLVVLFTLEMSIAITVEVLLTYVGIGVPSNVPSWGAVIGQGLSYFATDWWPTLFALILIVIVIVGLNLLGDGIREQFDPRLQSAR